MTDPVSLAKLAADIAEDVDKAVKVINRIKAGYNKRAKKINEILKDTEEELTDLINKIRAGLNGAANWAADKISAAIKKLKEEINAVIAWFKEKVEELDEWFNDIILKKKIKAVISSSAKLSIEMDEETAKSIAEALPPEVSISDKIPNPITEVPLPGMEKLRELLNYDIKIELPRLPILEVDVDEIVESAKDKVEEKVEEVTNTIEDVKDTANDIKDVKNDNEI
jgi:prefoldin subunit 5